MTEDQLQKMRECARRPQNSAQTVKVTCTDGDVLQGIAVFVSDAERDVIFEVASSNNPTKYQSGAHYLINWDDITDFQELD
jgi:DNA polymerase II small subunit/DNA polymerase delta subunit B